MNTEQEMRCCPFCGTSNKLKVTPYRADDDGGEPFDWGFTVICSALGFSHAPNRGCGASGAWGETEAEAIAAWNRRSSDEQAEVVAAKWMVVRNGELVLPLLHTEAEAKRYASVHDEEVAPLYRAPAVAAGGVTEALRSAMGMCEQYADFIRRVPAAEIEQHPYLPELEQVIEVARAHLAVGDEGIREGAKDTVDYVMRYGGRCRDCADENGTCPHSGLPCDTDAASKVIGFVLRAVDYGQRHGYLPTPPSRGEGV